MNNFLQPEQTQPENLLEEEFSLNGSSNRDGNGLEQLDSQPSTSPKQVSDLSDMLENFEMDETEKITSIEDKEKVNSNIEISKVVVDEGENEQNLTNEEDINNKNKQGFENQEFCVNEESEKAFMDNNGQTVATDHVIDEIEDQYPKRNNSNFESFIREEQDNFDDDNYGDDSYGYEAQDEEEDEEIEKPKFTIMGDYIADMEKTADADDIIAQIQRQFPKKGDEGFEKVLEEEIVMPKPNTFKAMVSGLGARQFVKGVILPLEFCSTKPFAFPLAFIFHFLKYLIDDKLSLRSPPSIEPPVLFHPNLF